MRHEPEAGSMKLVSWRVPRHSRSGTRWPVAGQPSGSYAENGAARSPLSSSTSSRHRPTNSRSYNDKYNVRAGPFPSISLSQRRRASFDQMAALLASARCSTATEDIVANLRALAEEAKAQIKRMKSEKEEQKAAQIEKWSHPASKPLPVEVLLEIFEYYLEENSRRIRCLMLVCRSWRSIVTNHSRFWTRLDFDLATDGWQSLKTYCEEQVLYVQACVRYSGTQLLTIDWNMEDLKWWEEYATDELINAIQNLASCKYIDVYDWASGVDLNPFIGEDLPFGHHQHAFNLFSLLVDIGNTEKWGILRLRFSESAVVNMEFLNYLNSVSSLPMLHTLGLHEDTDTDLTPITAFRSLQNLRSLEISSLLLIEDLCIPHSNLSSLRVDSCNNLEIFMEHPGVMKTLRELELSLKFSQWARNHSTSYTLSFPKLTILRVDLTYLRSYSKDSIDWSVPSLNYAFIRLDTFNEQVQLPGIAPRKLRWRFTDSQLSHNMERVSIMLRKVLVEYTTVEVLYLQAWTKVAALQVFQALREVQASQGRTLRVVFEKRYHHEVMAQEELAGVIEEMEVEL